jgi:O-antigen/teichoic acid export membrane protein
MRSLRVVLIRTYKHLMDDSLRRNSSLLILSQAINSGCAFIFWIVCAHLFRANIIGLATAFVSYGALAAIFTNLGLPNTIVRFLPMSKHKAGLFAASLYSILVSSVLGGVLALFLIKDLVPKLGFVSSSLILSITLMTLIALTAVSALMDGTLMAFRKGEYILGKAIIINIPRLILPFFVASLGLKGITGTYVFVFLFGVAYNAVIILSRLFSKKSFKPIFNEIRKHKSYVTSNYLGSMFAALPSALVPIIILSKLGANRAAYFYMPLQMAGFLGIVAASSASALIAEASQSENEDEHRHHFKNAFMHTYRILIPAIVVFCLLAWPVLLIYGKQYQASGFWPLIILTISSLFVSINYLGDTWLNVKRRSQAYFLMNACNAITVVGFVYLFAKQGLVSASFGWMLGQLASGGIYLIIFARGNLFSAVARLRA